MASFIADILGNRSLIIPLAAWCVAQALKVLISSIQDKRLNFFYLFSMGGMPSAHTTLVCALATNVAITHGVNSTLFAVTAFLAAIVMYDAAGVRQAVSNQASVLNRLSAELFEGRPVFERHLREIIGHTPIEVIAGAALGIFLAWWWT
jgi:acid phosphatase family membrane protein YuiD